VAPGREGKPQICALTDEVGKKFASGQNIAGATRKATTSTGAGEDSDHGRRLGAEQVWGKELEETREEEGSHVRKRSTATVLPGMGGTCKTEA